MAKMATSSNATAILFEGPAGQWYTVPGASEPTPENVLEALGRCPGRVALQDYARGDKDALWDIALEILRNRDWAAYWEAWEEAHGYAPLPPL